MSKTIIELVGIFLVVCGLVGLVIAAALVSTALAVGVAAMLLLFAGVSVVYLTNVLAASEKAKS